MRIDGPQGGLAPRPRQCNASPAACGGHTNRGNIRMDAVAPAPGPAPAVDLTELAKKLVADRDAWDKLHPDSDTAAEMAVAAMKLMQVEIDAGRGDALRIAFEDAGAPDLAEAVEELMEAAP